MLRGPALRAPGIAILPVILLAMADSQEPAPYQISVSVDLVVLHAAVRDRQGVFVPGLAKEHFQVSEDGVRQQVRLFTYEDIPVTVGLVVDHSGSMALKLPDVLTAVRVFAEASNPNDEMFVINFNEHVEPGLAPPMRFTNSAAALVNAITGMTATGQTALYDAVSKGLDQLAEGRRDKKVLVVISDGADNASRVRLDALLERIGASDVIVYAIGIFDEQAPDRNRGVLRRLARVSGGDAFIPSSTSGLVPACSLIAREIRSQYTIGYVSTNATPSNSYRRIRVTATAPGQGKLTVRTRSGYYATGRRVPAKSAK